MHDEEKNHPLSDHVLARDFSLGEDNVLFVNVLNFLTDDEISMCFLLIKKK